MAGYCGWPVARILVHSSAARAELPKATRAAKTLKRRNLFMIRGSLFPGRVEPDRHAPGEGASYSIFAGSDRPLACALARSTSACETFPALTSALTQAGERLGPALRMQMFRAAVCSP